MSFPFGSLVNGLLPVSLRNATLPFCDTSMDGREINISACSCLAAPPNSAGIPPQRMGNRDGKIVTPVVVTFFSLIDLVSDDVQNHTLPLSYHFSTLTLLEKFARVNQLIPP